MSLAAESEPPVTRGWVLRDAGDKMKRISRLSSRCVNPVHLGPCHRLRRLLRAPYHRDCFPIDVSPNFRSPESFQHQRSTVFPFRGRASTELISPHVLQISCYNRRDLPTKLLLHLPLVREKSVLVSFATPLHWFSFVNSTAICILIRDSTFFERSRFQFVARESKVASLNQTRGKLETGEISLEDLQDELKLNSNRARCHYPSSIKSHLFRANFTYTWLDVYVNSGNSSTRTKTRVITLMNICLAGLFTDTLLFGGCCFRKGDR